MKQRYQKLMMQQLLKIAKISLANNKDLHKSQLCPFALMNI